MKNFTINSELTRLSGLSMVHPDDYDDLEDEDIKPISFDDLEYHSAIEHEWTDYLIKDLCMVWGYINQEWKSVELYSRGKIQGYLHALLMHNLYSSDVYEELDFLKNFAYKLQYTGE